MLTKEAINRPAYSPLAAFLVASREDPAGLRQVIQGGLESAGYQVLAAGDASGRDIPLVTKCRGYDIQQQGIGVFDPARDENVLWFACYDVSSTAAFHMESVTGPVSVNARIQSSDFIFADMAQRLSLANGRFVSVDANGAACEELISSLVGDRWPEMVATIRNIEDYFSTSEPVIRDLSAFGRRAKVELIETQGGLGVLKTFKPHRMDLYHNELKVVETLGSKVDWAPEIIWHREGKICYRYYEDVLRYTGDGLGLFPIRTALDVARIVRNVYDLGFQFMDLNPWNVLVDKNSGLKLVDLEFVTDRVPAGGGFWDCYDVAGAPADLDLPMPYGGTRSFDHNWKPHTGLSLRQMLELPGFLVLVLWCLAIPGIWWGRFWAKGPRQFGIRTRLRRILLQS